MNRKTPKTPCIYWPGQRNAGGYGYLTVKVTGKSRLAHRVAYEQAYGPIPQGLVIDHLCRERACINPEHLQAVTPAINSRRAKGAWHPWHGRPTWTATKRRNSDWGRLFRRLGWD